MFGTGMFSARTFGKGMFSTALRKKRAVGLVLLVVLLSLFLWFNRIPKLDTVQADLLDATAPASACFQGFCVDNAPGSTLFSRWWDFSLAYLELVSLGMVFAFLIAGLTEVFLFPSSRGAQGGWAQPGIRGSLRGLLVGSAMNLCSACIVPISSAFRRRGAGLETSLAIVQGSATLNLPALLMAAMVFTPMLAGSRVGLSLVGALLLGPLVARLAGQKLSPLPDPLPWDGTLEQVQMSWSQVLTQGCRDWLIASAKYLLRLGPLMVVAGFAGALAIQWVSPQTVGTYLGDNALGVVIAATLGLLINVPLLFEIPLVAALLLVGMGTAPAAVLLFAAAAGGPVTFWGLARVMPKRVVATFATATWGLAAVGGLAILALGPLIGGGTNIRAESANLHVTESAREVPPRVTGASIQSVEPDAASVLGGSMVAIVGTGFVDGSRVAFGGVETEVVELLDSTTLVVLAPPQANGSVNVTVTLPDGNTRNLPAGFRYQQPIFSEASVEAGVDFMHYRDLLDIVPFGAGLVVFDYDNDQDQDIYVTSTENKGNLVGDEGNNALYRNNGDGTFTEVGTAAGVADLEGKGNGGCAADYDNDGDQDLFVANWGSSKLFENNGDGTFRDATGYTGLGDPDTTYRSMGCAWGDYDRDGLLDLVVVRHIDESRLAEDWSSNRQGGFIDLIVAPYADASNSYQAYIELYFSGVKPLALYHNEGDGTFSEVTHLLGDIGEPSFEQGNYGNVWGAGFQPGWLDFDNDGDPDLYVVNDFGEEVQPNVLWRNDGARADGSWKFADISAESGANAAVSGMGLAVGDYNVDGFLDLFITNMGDDVLLVNDGDGLRLTNNADGAGVAAGLFRQRERVSWGTVFLDYDNDGYEDLYVVSGFLDTDPHENRREQPNLLFHNNGGSGVFADVSSISGADDPGVGRGVAYADFNGDGCLDLYQTNLGKSAYIGESARLFLNNCEWSNNWIVIRTEGTVSNRDGIGARVSVDAGEITQIREVAAGGSNKSQNMLPVHFGLGSAEVVDSIEILWPSGKLQTLSNVAVNQYMVIREPG